jgi:hypothetical protein
MHQSELDGRRINVELTAGGGGKGDDRLAKVKTRNKLLAAQRVRLFHILFLPVAAAKVHGCFTDAADPQGGDTAGDG